MSLVKTSLRYYWRTNLPVVLGVATAVAVLTGALLVGDSVRGSLRALALARLGNAEGVVSSAQLFREDLAKDVPGSVPILVLRGVATHEKDGRRAAGIAIYGIDDRFWKFNGLAGTTPASGEARLSPALARELAAADGDQLLLRVEKPSAIPRESLVGRKEDAGRTIRVTMRGEAGEFALRPTQGDVFAIYVPLRRLQRDLAQQGKVNTLLLASTAFPKDKVTLEDLGVKVREVSGGLSVESQTAVLSDALAAKVRDIGGSTARPVLSYIANSIRDGDRQVPYSIVAALDQGWAADAIYLSEWTAKDLGAKVGDPITLEYFFWDPTGALLTKNAEFRVAGVLPMSGLATDRDLTPEYPGITEAQTIGDWDPPFPVDLKRVRKQDEDYWKQYKTSPKAFISLEAGQKLWSSRFGKLTSIRIDGATDASAFAQKLRASLDPEQLGMAIVHPREQALAAAQGSTDFGEYFTYFSFFLVVSALMLAGLFFQLGIEQRLREIGTLRAVGFPASRIRRQFLTEGFVLSAIGTLIGTVGAIAYAAFLLYGLKTWWRGAVGTGLLTLHISPLSLTEGAIGGVVIATLCVLATLRSLKRSSPRDLLSGTRGASATPHRGTRVLRIVAAASILSGLALVGAAFAHKVADSEGFFGAGTLLLIGAICFEWAQLRAQTGTMGSVLTLGIRNASYRPGRSVLSIALIASAVFLVVSLDAFRRPPVSPSDPKSGAGGFALAAESQLPLFWDPNTPTGRENLNMTSTPPAKFFSFRLRPGEDSSCLNLYEPRTPRILGASKAFLALNRFSFSEVIDKSPNPWALLDSAPGADGSIPAIADANSITYVLHRKVGDVFDAGGVKLRLVAALDDSILQSELIISDANFVRAFPEQQGYRYFLIDTAASSEGPLEQALSDYGFDATSTPERLAAYHRVENTYLSTFQALGALGLLLGTVGLAAVLLRNVMERRREMGLLRAVGYRPENLRMMVIAENAFLLLAGMAIGVVCAVVAIAPAFLGRGGHLPSPSLALLLLAVPVTGMIASLLAVRTLSRAPVLAALRAE